MMICRLVLSVVILSIGLGCASRNTGKQEKLDDALEVNHKKFKDALHRTLDSDAKEKNSEPSSESKQKN